MRRAQGGGRVAYRERRWGWSLIVFLVFPACLIALEEGAKQRDPVLTWAAGAGATASVLASCSLLRTDAWTIDRGSRTLSAARFRHVWSTRRSYPLSQVRAVRLGLTVVEHALSSRIGWLEPVYRIGLEVGRTRVIFVDQIPGLAGKRLALQLAEDLGVPVRRGF